MKRGQYRVNSASCPFYKKETQYEVLCNGVEPNTSIHLAFGNFTECSVYKKRHCRQDHEACEIYKMLEKMRSNRGA